MGVGRFAVGLPVGRLLQVEHLVGHVVAPGYVFAVGIPYGPWLAAEALALGVEHIELGYGCQLLAVVGVEPLYGHVAPFGGGAEPHCLPSVAGGERTLRGQWQRLGVERLAGLAVGGGAGDVELVEFRLGAAGAHGLARGADDVEHYHLVAALLEPASRHVERLLRADVPVAAYGVVVDVDKALAEGLHVEEGVAGLSEREVAPVVSAAALGVGHHLDVLVYAVVNGAQGVGVGVGYALADPVAQGPLHLVAANLGPQRYGAGDALGVVDGAAKVDAAHALYEYGQRLPFLHGGQCERALALHAVDGAYVLAVDEHLCVVVCLVDGEHAPHGYLGQLGAVVHCAPSHVHLLEGEQLAALCQAVGPGH